MRWWTAAKVAEAAGAQGGGGVAPEPEKGAVVDCAFS